MECGGTVENPVIQARGLRKECFRKGRDAAYRFDAVSHVDLDLAAGEFVALMGRSGSGKTTLLNLLAGLSAPTEGIVRVCGCDLASLGDGELSAFRNAHIGMVVQGPSVLSSLTAVQNVMLPMLMYQNDAQAESKALALLERLGMRALADCSSRELSGGEARRVAIARALACAPDVVLADEPTADLDDENTELVLDLLRETARPGAAVLLVTHEQAAARVADRVMRMDAGALARM